MKQLLIILALFTTVGIFTDSRAAETKQTTDETSGKTKLKNLGLTDDEIKALIGK